MSWASAPVTPALFSNQLCKFPVYPTILILLLSKIPYNLTRSEASCLKTMGEIFSVLGEFWGKP